MPSITPEMVLEVRRACGHIGLAACRSALEATSGDVDATIRRLTGLPPPAPAFDRAAATEATLRHVRARRDELAARVRLAAPDQRGVRLADEVREGCPSMDVVLEVRPFEALAGVTAVNPEDVADALADALGLSMQGNHWIRIELSAARRAFAWLIGHSLVWGTPEMPEQQAAELRDRFFALFAGAPTFLATDAWESAGRPNAINPMAGGTFGAALVVLDDARVGLLCVTEED